MVVATSEVPEERVTLPLLEEALLPPVVMIGVI
jgi:hypothetical protein